MRTFALSTILGLAAFSVAPSVSATMTRAPWIHDAQSSQVTIAWEAASSGGTQSVAYGLGTQTNLNATGTLVSGSLYTAVLTGLIPASKYTYQVTSSSDSGGGTFVTAPLNGGQTYKFTVYGDNRTNDTNHQQVVDAIIAAGPPDFAINTGDLEDMTSTGGNTSYDVFFQIEGALLANTPMFPAPGNHDVMTYYPYGFDRCTTDGSNCWYSFHWGNAFFVSLDASSSSGYAPGDPQLTWLDSQLSAAKADPTVNWIFVYHHYPVYSSGSGHGSTASMSCASGAGCLNDLYAKYGVDIVFNGHDHIYERLEDTSTNLIYIVAGGGGAPLYSVGSSASGCSGSCSILGSLANYSFVNVDINGGTLTLNALDTTGSIVDSRTVTKVIGPPVTPTPTPVGTGSPGGTPTPNPTDTPTGDGAAASGHPKGCDVSSGAASGMAGSLLAGLTGIGVLLRRRRVTLLP